MRNQEILDILHRDAHVIDEQLNVNLPTKNGILDPLDVEVHRGLCIAQAIDSQYNKLVTVKQKYPKNGTSDVRFAADAVILDGRDYRRLLELLNQ